MASRPGLRLERLRRGRERSPEAMMGENGGTQGMSATVGIDATHRPTDVGDPQPSYVYDLTPNAEVNYHASFFFNANDSASGAKPVDIFLGLDQNYEPMFGVQYQVAPGSTDDYQLRAWVMQSDQPVYTGWTEIDDSAHRVQVAWQSSNAGDFSLFVDDNLAGIVVGNTSAYQLEEVLLGPSLGLTPGTAGELYFDDFVSTRVTPCCSRSSCLCSIVSQHRIYPSSKNLLEVQASRRFLSRIFITA